MSSRSLSATPLSAAETGAAVGAAAALAGSVEGAVASGLGSCFMTAGAECVSRASMSLAVSGGGSDVSGTGTAVCNGLSACCAPAWLDQASTSTSAVEARRRSNRALFTTFSPNCRGGPYVRFTLTDSEGPVTFFRITSLEQSLTVAILQD